MARSRRGSPVIPCYLDFFRDKDSLPFVAGACTLDVSRRILGLFFDTKDLGKRHQISVGAACKQGDNDSATGETLPKTVSLRQCQRPKRAASPAIIASPLSN